ncbi:MAG: metallophosphoesterase [Oscillospiraceae bacterium]|nr:metallophosphoesterase [Oscillospiraceae bacterium]
MIYVTSDLHGFRPETFQALLARAGFSDDDFLFILGDVIDRGEHGAALLLWLTQQPNMQLILGNHEALLLACRFLFRAVNEDSLADLTGEHLLLLENWMQNGGSPTLAGFRKLLRDDPDLVEGILEYLEDAPLYETVETGGRQYVLVHSGLGNFRPDKDLDDYTAEELLMTRPTPDDAYWNGTTVVFGHTPTEYFSEASRGRAFRTPTWICIDTGAARCGTPMLLRLDDEREFY